MVACHFRSRDRLFAVFTDPVDYMDQWASDAGPVERRYGKPSFTVVGNQLRITTRQYFRLDAGATPIEISDLPFVRFEWALNLMEGHAKSTDVAPVTIVVLMYTEEDFVDVGGHSVFRGTRYLDNAALSFGPITPAHILVAS
ncbi:hypothetical protein DLD99_08535 [Pseudomonas kribbensis]|uniref:Uncharacterized protein n=1 Tax=Pseudomonas kribbensis TaxID=1628086 RepID=A0A345RMK1_9PSED|nr:hypothetical protein DLD99_08535 [Pseudomonas kribbensis]